MTAADGQLVISDGLALPLEGVTETFAILAKRGGGKTYCASVMVEELVGAGQPVVVIDPVGVWWGLRSSADGEGPGLPVVIFGGDHADLPLPDEAGETIADLIMDERIPAVLDLSHLSKTKGRNLVRVFMERLYFRNREPLHLVVDEADLFAPQRGGADTARLVGAYEDIVRRGRARGLGCTSITQRPASLHKDILTQSEVLIALRMTGVRDVAAINEWVNLHAEEGEAAKVRASLAALPVGTAWVWSPGWLGILQQVRIRARRTFDSSATPKPGQRIVEPRRFADVDLDRIRARLTPADTEPGTGPGTVLTGKPVISAAQAYSRARIATLTARVTELEGQLAQARAEVRIVEVLALTDADHDRLRAALTALTTAVRPITAALNQQRPAAPAAPAEDRGAKVATLDRGMRWTPPAAGTVQQYAQHSAPADSHQPAGRTLAKAERAILTVLAQHGARTTTQVALLTGYSAKSGGFRNALSSLRTAEFITGRGTGTVEATTAGKAALSVWEPLPQGPDLIKWWYEKLGKAERMILAELVAAWPEPVPVDQIAARTNYSATSGGFRNALSRLRSLELAVGERGRGELTAADVLGKARTAL